MVVLGAEGATGDLGAWAERPPRFNARYPCFKRYSAVGLAGAKMMGQERGFKVDGQ